jgi:hypothetical protein
VRYRLVEEINVRHNQCVQVCKYTGTKANKKHNGLRIIINQLNYVQQLFSSFIVGNHRQDGVSSSHLGGPDHPSIPLRVVRLRGGRHKISIRHKHLYSCSAQGAAPGCIWFSHLTSSMSSARRSSSSWSSSPVRTAWKTGSRRGVSSRMVASSHLSG